MLRVCPSIDGHERLCKSLALSPLGGEGGPRRRNHQSVAGRVRGFQHVPKTVLMKRAKRRATPTTCRRAERPSTDGSAPRASVAP